MRKLRSILRSKYLFKVLVVLALIYSFLVMFVIESGSEYDGTEREIEGIIQKLDIDGSKVALQIYGKEKLIVNYYSKTEVEKNYYVNNLHLGDRVVVLGTLKSPSSNTIPNGFNYARYLKVNQIFFVVQAEKIEKISNNTNIFYWCKNMTLKRIDMIDKSGYFRTFILGDKSLLEEEIFSCYQTNGLLHLFSISGMHVGLIVKILIFILDKVSYNRYYKYGIVLNILIFYLFLTGFSSSIVRTVLMFFVFSLNDCFNFKIKKVDLLLLVLILAIIFKPFIIFDMGFQFSYLISTTLVLLAPKINKVKGNFWRSLYVSWISFLVSLPICIFYFYQVNFLSILWNLIMIPIVSSIIFPMTLLVFLVPKFYFLYELVIKILESINIFCSEIRIAEVIFAKPSIVVVLCYYIVIYGSFFKKRLLGVLLVLLFVHKNINFLDSKFLFTVLDVGQGDCLLIKFPYNRGTILVDIAGKTSTITEDWQKRRSEYKIAVEKVVPYLKSLGVDKLDYLIITHGDYDHMGEAKNLILNFKVSNVIFNLGEYNTLELELSRLLKEKKISYFKRPNELKIFQYKLYFLNQTIYEDENDNSNIIYFPYNGYRFLLMGDAGVQNEVDILENYDLNNITFLKVGHHGSKTSTSQYFVNMIAPKVSFISVGMNNRYNHPNQEVLERLANSKIYRTDQVGSIVVNIDKKVKILTYAP